MGQQQASTHPEDVDATFGHACCNEALSEASTWGQPLRRSHVLQAHTTRHTCI